MPAVYDKYGIRFIYPENWTLDDETTPENPDAEARCQLSVLSPHTAFWSLTVYPELRDVQHLLEEVLAVMRAEYPDLEHHEDDQLIDGTQLAGFEINFVCLDQTNTAWARVFHHAEGTCLLLCQSEDKELKQVEPVLEAMTLSLLRRGEMQPEALEDDGESC